MATKKPLAPQGRVKSTKSFEEWADAAPNTLRKRCVTCQLGEELLEDVRKFLRLKAEKAGAAPSNRQFYVYLQEKYEYSYTLSALEQHIRSHEPDLWRKVRRG
jgi:hypothetical protein